MADRKGEERPGLTIQLNQSEANMAAVQWEGPSELFFLNNIGSIVVLKKEDGGGRFKSKVKAH